MLDTMTIGHALRRSRELAGITDRAAARSIGVSRSTLRAWESDRALPDTEQISLAAGLYGHGVQDVWASREPLHSPDEPGVLTIGTERIMIEPDQDEARAGTFDNRVVLSRYIAAVRRQRGLEPREPMELRADDLAALSTVLNLDDDQLQASLAELLDLTPAGAQWAVRSMLVGGLVALAATGALGTSWFASPVSAAPMPSPVAAEAAPPTTTSASAVETPTDVSAPGMSIERGAPGADLAPVAPEVTEIDTGGVDAGRVDAGGPVVEISDEALTIERTSPFSVGNAEVASSTVTRGAGESPFSVDDVNGSAMVVTPPVFQMGTGPTHRPMDQLFLPDGEVRQAPAALPAPDA